MLIAAISGRALAQSARRSGYVPLVADFFADLDTAEAAEEVVKVEGVFGEGFKREPLMKALQQLAAGRHPIGIVSGAGFEQSGDLLNEVATHWPVLGNEPETISILKDPISFADVCANLGIPHPEIRLDPPSSGEWLVKETGASGGSHVRTYSPLLPSESWGKVRASCYFQGKVSGESISALFLAHGSKLQIIGFSRQWTAPTGDEPFRYGGAVQPAEFSSIVSYDPLVPSSRRKPGPIHPLGKASVRLSLVAPWVPAFAGMTEDRRAELSQNIAQIVSVIPLKGLNSADFIVDGDQHWLLEINPRPGATLDIFPGELFKAHVEACQGKLPKQPFRFEGAHAAAIVYAERDIQSVAAIAWPDWAMDRQAPGTSVAVGEPLCTVRAEAATVSEAMKLLKQREVSIRQQVEGNAA